MTSQPSGGSNGTGTPLPVLRIVGPPGSGKTLLITSLVEALRARGHLVTTSASRGEATVITLSNGGRITVEHPLTLPALRALVASVDPRAALLLAESLTDPVAPAIEVVPAGSQPTRTSASLLAAVSTAQVRGDFATFGPGETHGLADLVESRVIRGALAPPPKRGLLDRLRRVGKSR